jgi:hypothetical protein
MNLKAALTAYLLTQAGVTDLVSQRIYYRAIPQQSGFLPAVLIARTGCQREYDLAGQPIGWATATVRIGVASGDDQLSQQIADAVRAAMTALLASSANPAIGGIPIQTIELNDDPEEPYFAWEGEDQGVCPVELEYEIAYNENP